MRAGSYHVWFAAFAIVWATAAFRGAPCQGAPASAASGGSRGGGVSSPRRTTGDGERPIRIRGGGETPPPWAATTEADRWSRVLTLRDHNTRVVLLGTTLLGLAAGVVGSFTLLRKRALVGDALSHATFPGIGGAFLIGTAAGLTEKSLPLLLLGAAVSGVLGVGVLLFLRRYTRLKEDTALGVVLSTFFGAGLAVLGLVQQSGSGSAAGLGSFIYGKTASMVPDDVRLIAAGGLLAVLACGLLLKEFTLLCFDQGYAATQGWPVPVLDAVLMGLVVLVTVIGLQAVGLILVIALLITPAAAARFWTDRVPAMTALAGLLGAVSGLVGAGVSAVYADLPSGALIVLVAAAAFGAEHDLRHRPRRAAAGGAGAGAPEEGRPPTPAPGDSRGAGRGRRVASRGDVRAAARGTLLVARPPAAADSVRPPHRSNRAGGRSVHADRSGRGRSGPRRPQPPAVGTVPDPPRRRGPRPRRPRRRRSRARAGAGDDRGVGGAAARGGPRRRPRQTAPSARTRDEAGRRAAPPAGDCTMTAALQTWDWSLDGWIVAVGALCAAACALPGNFLVLRRMSMMGDALSHAVLPGLAAAFLITDSRTSAAMFVGAAVVGVLTALFTEWVRGYGRVDEGASMGVVFTTLFAAGLVLIVQAADSVDLDPGCVLYGALEFTPLDTVAVAGAEVPRVGLTLGVVLLVNLAFVAGFYKELKVSSFDPALATTLGIPARLMHYALMTLVAVTAVASFEAVGNILVVAVLIVPPAAAHLLTDRLPVMIALSVLIAVASAVLGHLGAIALPAAFGYGSVSTAGMIAVACGLLFTLAVLFGPRHGVLARAFHRAALSLRIAGEDLLGLLYRVEEHAAGPAAVPSHLGDALHLSTPRRRLLVRSLAWRGLVREDGGGLVLTDRGRGRARELVRSHRLWESYLDRYTAVRTDHLHLSAERLEHATGPGLRAALDTRTDSPGTDPHGTPIPPGDAR